MTRVLEFIVALVIVAILALIVGVLLPSSGHIERSTTVSKDIRHVYDILNNFRRFPDYSMLRAYDPELEYHQSNDDWYGPGAHISWTSDTGKVGDGSLKIVSAKPGFDKVEVAGNATIVWVLDNDWHGTDKTITIHLQRTGNRQKLVEITWGYDVDYGWNLVNRYAGLYIHGRPDSLMERSLNNLVSVLATIPNIGYDGLDPWIVERPAQPVLMVATSAKRNLTYVDAASEAAVDQIHDAMKKLGLHQTGPRIRFTTNYGNQDYAFTVAIPVDSDSVTLNGKQYAIQPPHVPGHKGALAPAVSSAHVASVTTAASVANAASAANAATSEGASSVAGSESAAVAKAGSAGKAQAAPVGPKPGDRDDHGRLIINEHVRAMLAFGEPALMSVWYGSPAGIPPTRLRLKAYAGTHGYPFDVVNHRLYDRQIRGYGDKGPDGEPIPYDRQFFKIYLPLQAAPEHTPEQAAGMKPVSPFVTPGNASSSPANATSAPAHASSAPAEAATAD